MRDDRDHVSSRASASRSGRARSSRSPVSRATARPSSSRRSSASGRSTPARSSSTATPPRRPRPATSRTSGVAHVPEDRMRDGLIGAMTVAENFILDTYHREPYSTRGQPQRRRPSPRARRPRVKDYDVRTPSIETYAGSLSGGNQQKVVVAREFSPAREAGRRRPSRPVASTSGPSSTSTGGWSSSGTPAPRCSSSAPSWTRCSRWATGWPSCWEAGSSASWRARRRPTRSVGMLMGGAG